MKYLIYLDELEKDVFYTHYTPINRKGLSLMAKTDSYLIALSLVDKLKLSKGYK